MPGNEAGNGLQKSGLAGAIWSNQGDPVAAGSGKGDTLEGRNQAIGDAHIVDHQFMMVVVVCAAIVTTMVFRFQN